jgi:hypothetical protein
MATVEADPGVGARVEQQKKRKKKNRKRVSKEETIIFIRDRLKERPVDDQPGKDTPQTALFSQKRPRQT